MCLPIDCWLCTPRTDDDHYHAPATKHSAPPLARNGGGHHYNGNGGHYYNGTGYPVQGAAAAGTEAARKASNDARPRGWQGHAPAQEKMVAYPYAAAADGTLKQQHQHQQAAAANGRVAADGARGVAHNYYYEREQPPAHKGKEDAVDSYYHPAATVAPADHESPSEALGKE